MTLHPRRPIQPNMAWEANCCLAFDSGSVSLSRAVCKSFFDHRRYPSAAGKIVSNGPYSSVSEIYSIKGLSNEEKAAIKKHESKFITMEPQAMYTIDRINNGLYR
ncbi:unnamed protein product [Ectocarpus sp. 12 AP-2014]